MSEPHPELIAPLQRMGLLLPHDEVTFTPLTGGVSSLIVRVDTPTQSFCLKRALPQLKVAALWEAPVKRNRDEVAWLRFAAQHLPQAVPALLGEDETDCVFAMAYLPAEQHPVWKQQLRDGLVDVHTAEQVAHCLATWHGASAHNAVLAQTFDHDADFIAIRLILISMPLPCVTLIAPTLCTVWCSKPWHTNMSWCMATSARKTFWRVLTAPFFWMPNALGTATPPLTWLLCSTIYC